MSWRTRALLRKYWWPVWSAVQAFVPLASQMTWVETFTTETFLDSASLPPGPLRPGESAEGAASAGGWPSLDKADDVSPPSAAAEPTSRQEYLTSAATVAAGLLGIAGAWAGHGAGRVSGP